MFQLLAIITFFILGLAFFAIGKDDFGIKKIKEDLNDSSYKDKELDSPDVELNNKPNKDKQEISIENQSGK